MTMCKSGHSFDGETARQRTCSICAQRRKLQWLSRQGLAVIIVSMGMWLTAGNVFAGSNILSWTDNSTNEDNFRIQRTTAADVPACQTAAGFTEIAVTGLTIVTFTDTVVTEGLTYCYRVSASNTAGPSAFSNVAGRTVPFSVPLAPSGLVVN